jgi:hypothetical protein
VVQDAIAMFLGDGLAEEYDVRCLAVDGDDGRIG